MNNTSMKESNSGPNGSNLMNNKSMNNISMKETNSGLKTATLMDNTTVNSNIRK